MLTKYVNMKGRKMDYSTILTKYLTREEEGHIYGQIMVIGRYYFTLMLTEYLYSQYPVTYHPVVFRNRIGSYHTTLQGTHVIVYGYDSIRRAYEQFIEYKTVKALWWPQYRELHDYKGIWALVLHEFAHVLQRHRYPVAMNGSKRDVHGEDFLDCLYELIHSYQFSKIQELDFYTVAKALGD